MYLIPYLSPNKVNNVEYWGCLFSMKVSIQNKVLNIFNVIT